MAAEILNMDKTISISSKNQITIPKVLIEFLGFEKEAKIKTDGNSIIITPVKKDNFDFSDLILADLIKEGYEGNDILVEFRRRTGRIKPAVKEMVEEAKKNPVTFEDIFGEE